MAVLLSYLLFMVTLASCQAFHEQPGKQRENFNEIQKRIVIETIENYRKDNQIQAGDVNCSSEKLFENQVSYCMEQIEDAYLDWQGNATAAGWQYETNLTDHNSDVLTQIENDFSEWWKVQVAWAKVYYKKADKYDEKLKRKLEMMSLSTVPKDSATQVKLSRLSQTLTSLYAQATLNKEGKTLHLDPDIMNIMSESRDWDDLLWAWQGWRDATGLLMRENFTEFVTLQNQAARENGFKDMGEAWRVTNFETDNIENMVDDLYQDIRPLYEQLHTYVRRKLIQAYPDHGIDARGPIPAHLLGNMWAQEWTDILDLVLPFPESPSFDVTQTLKEDSYDAVRMFKLAESFFASLGLDNMTKTFWNKTMMTRPDDGRDVVCHASAYDMYSRDCSDFRIKMCTGIDMNNLKTIHHEMGHIQYYMLYCPQSVFFRDGANSAFHEAVGDTIALSVMTPEHLQRIGLLEQDSQPADSEMKFKSEMNFLMRAALEKVAFLPFGYLVDKWRWEVFRGDITPNLYNERWWQMRNNFQGITSPVPRSENDFDAGSKFHVAANVPYIRYFLSFILQFQFHEALCNTSGHVGGLHHCDTYGSEAAGDLLKRTLGLGSSKPWPEVMQIFTGGKTFSSESIMRYFQPLNDWLKDVNQKNNETVGWES